VVKNSQPKLRNLYTKTTLLLCVVTLSLSKGFALFMCDTFTNSAVNYEHHKIDSKTTLITRHSEYFISTLNNKKLFREDHHNKKQNIIFTSHRHFEYFVSLKSETKSIEKPLLIISNKATIIKG